jgi:hypothetical protein
MKISFGYGARKSKNVFAAAAKNPLEAKKVPIKKPPEKVSEASRSCEKKVTKRAARWRWQEEDICYLNAI